MNQFDLKDYLKDNKLLKEEKETLNESVALFTILYALLGSLSFTAISRLFGPAIGELLKPFSKRLQKLAKKARTSLSKYKDLELSDNYWLKFIESRRLGGAAVDLQNDLTRTAEEGGKREQYRDKDLLMWYKDAVVLIDAAKDLLETVFNLMNEFDELEKIIKEKEEKGEDIPKEEMKAFEDKKNELKIHKEQMLQRTSYTRDLKFIKQILKNEIDRRGLKVENINLSSESYLSGLN